MWMSALKKQMIVCKLATTPLDLLNVAVFLDMKLIWMGNLVEVSQSVAVLNLFHEPDIAGLG